MKTYILALGMMLSVSAQSFAEKSGYIDEKSRYINNGSQSNSESGGSDDGRGECFPGTDDCSGGSYPTTMGQCESENGSDAGLSFRDDSGGCSSLGSGG